MSRHAGGRHTMHYGTFEVADIEAAIKELMTATYPDIGRITNLALAGLGIQDCDVDTKVYLFTVLGWSYIKIGNYRLAHWGLSQAHMLVQRLPILNWIDALYFIETSSLFAITCATMGMTQDGAHIMQGVRARIRHTVTIHPGLKKLMWYVAVYESWFINMFTPQSQRRRNYARTA